MFGRKKSNDLDIENLNEVILLSKKILRVLFAVVIITVAVLSISLLKMISFFKIVKDILVVISPVFIGILIAWLFDPIVKFLEKKKFPRIVACIIVYIVFFGILGFLLFMMMPSFINQIKDFAATIPQILRDSKDFVSSTLNTFGNTVNMDVSGLKTKVLLSLESFGNGLTNNLPNTILGLGKKIISGGMFVILGIMIGFYMLYDFDRLNKKLLEVVPKRYYNDAKDLMGRINHSLREYIIGVLVVMSLVFVTQAICLSVIGLKAPLIFALFCALTDIIPYFGPYIGAIPAVLVAFTISPFTGICCIIAIVIVQLLENNFYQPLIMGHAMKLHPVTIMVGLLIFEHFFGIIGMIVATPVVATIKVILMFIDEKLNVLKKIKEN